MDRKNALTMALGTGWKDTAMYDSCLVNSKGNKLHSSYSFDFTITSLIPTVYIVNSVLHNSHTKEYTGTVIICGVREKKGFCCHKGFWCYKRIYACRFYNMVALYFQTASGSIPQLPHPLSITSTATIAKTFLL